MNKLIGVFVGIFGLIFMLSFLGTIFPTAIYFIMGASLLGGISWMLGGVK